ncbi:sirohydrochlorin chelatase [Actinocrispum wychmicini]|uniref:Sirohydrochlorin ferrochelatase n=1 Tax=Actinocrispum wychmicini TaxID=1213861 RepID=A0A4R2JNF1_9PSEU|nr:CbiX/SirB N-terminal domain-containing protein [Actinocrispum wychmicini]TCO58666.1 sirohydrochlorin ferrochelatase [Actinocrispum wychmicini]
MTLVLAAHGTRDSAGSRVVHDLARRVRDRLSGVDVRVAFADVRSPSVAEVVASVAGPVVVVPAFLAAGYHVRVDIPAQVLRSGHSQVTFTEPLGPSSALVAAMHERLVEAGWRNSPLVLAAAGSSDPRALADVRTAARLLASSTSVPVRIGYLATARPLVADVLCDNDFVASWLLAPGVFHRMVRDLTGRVSEPIGAHPNVVDLVVRRYKSSNSPGGPVSGRTASQR